MTTGRVALLVLVALAFGACAGAEATTLAPHHEPVADASAPVDIGLRPGETMAFDLRIGGVLAGTAQLAVGDAGQVDGRRAVVVKSRAATAGALAVIKNIVDEATTVIDLDTGRPVQLDTHVEDNGDVSEAHAKFGPRSATVTFTHGDARARAFRVDFGDNPVHDTHSAMAQLRGWRAAPGATKTVLVVSGRRLWRVELHFGGKETIGSALGNRRTVRLTGAAYRAGTTFGVSTAKPTRTFTVWLSDDADRVPLKLTASTELGEVAMELTEYARQ
jgi:hypothetical protein